MSTVNSRQYQRRRTAGQWTAENPVLESGEIGVVGGGAVLGLKVGDGATAWNDLPGPLWVEDIPEIASGDPTELSISVAGGTATFALLEPIARQAFKFRAGQYYVEQTATAWAASPGLTQNTLYYQPYWLVAGTLDRIGLEVITAQASATIRMGVYLDDDGQPGNRVAEATSGADTYPLVASTNGPKNAAISAVLPRNGLYWLAFVAQGAAAVTVQSPNSTTIFPLPLGTSPPSNGGVAGGSTFGSITETGITGAIPATAAATLAVSSTDARIPFRYSSVG